ncbi:MAG: hypothetical protein KAH97_05670, partial [Anaerolineales bacterium]|nr:hypothetical protein [Anaerolineales bacterium]
RGAIYCAQECLPGVGVRVAGRGVDVYKTRQVWKPDLRVMEVKRNFPHVILRESQSVLLWSESSFLHGFHTNLLSSL